MKIVDVKIFLLVFRGIPSMSSNKVELFLDIDNRYSVFMR